jgi:hypothetical protein
MLHTLGQVSHEVHWIEVEGHWPIKVAPQHVSPKELVHEDDIEKTAFVTQHTI